MSKEVIKPENDKERKAIINEKLWSLIKEADGFNARYGLESAIIVEERDQNNNAVMWPSREKCNELLTKFAEIPDSDKVKNMVTHEDFLKKRLLEVDEQVTRLQNKNDAKETSLLLLDVMQGKISINELKLDQVLKLQSFAADKLRKLRNAGEIKKEI